MENDVVKGEATLVITYAIMAIIAAILLLGYIALVRPKEPWLLLLYVCVTIVNVGYFLLSVSPTLTFAIFANDLAYLGSVFLSMSMLLTIIKLCGFTVKKKLILSLLVFGCVMFAIIATSGILPWYYKEVSLVHVEGASKLNKVYGVLHPVYMVYLLIYFAAWLRASSNPYARKCLRLNGTPLFWPGLFLAISPFGWSKNLSLGILSSFRFPICSARSSCWGYIG